MILVTVSPPHVTLGNLKEKTPEGLLNGYTLTLQIPSFKTP